ncbi:hypothetical protein GCM10009801_20790 [Streptomyces albiaxialis]|uniref:Phage holin family protein n=1 Tax=Streptomyces albiaxialis TaxID=329523 RepID=A0ABN2VTF4_9ACTN
MDDSVRQARPPQDASVGELVRRASEQLGELVRAEMRLARAEMAHKGRRYGRGGGLFGAAGVAGFLALQALVASAIAGLALALSVWAAGLIVTGVLLAVAAVMAAVGRKEVREAAPPTPEQAVENVKTDVSELKERAHR